jgi:hypothetical protein
MSDATRAKIFGAAKRAADFMKGQAKKTVDGHSKRATPAVKPVPEPKAPAKPRGGPTRSLAADVAKARVTAKPATRPATRPPAPRAAAAPAKAKPAYTRKDTEEFGPPKPTRTQRLKSTVKSAMKGQSAQKSYDDYKKLMDF